MSPVGHEGNPVINQVTVLYMYIVHLEKTSVLLAYRKYQTRFDLMCWMR